MTIHPAPTFPSAGSKKSGAKYLLNNAAIRCLLEKDFEKATEAFQLILTDAGAIGKFSTEEIVLTAQNFALAHTLMGNAAERIAVSRAEVLDYLLDDDDDGGGAARARYLDIFRKKNSDSSAFLEAVTDLLLAKNLILSCIGAARGIPPQADEDEGDDYGKGNGGAKNSRRPGILRKTLIGTIIVVIAVVLLGLVVYYFLNFS